MTVVVIFDFALVPACPFGWVDAVGVGSEGAELLAFCLREFIKSAGVEDINFNCGVGEDGLFLAGIVRVNGPGVGLLVGE